MTEEMQDFEEQDSPESLTTYAELYADLLLNDEIVITVMAEDIPRLKTGLKNVKAKRTHKYRADGIPIDNATISFKEEPSKTIDIDGAVDLTITLSSKATVRILGMRIPENEF